jgi:hypothetical protein
MKAKMKDMDALDLNRDELMIIGKHFKWNTAVI